MAQTSLYKPISFAERHPASAIELLGRRMGFGARSLMQDPKRGKYDIHSEGFQIYEPPAGSTPGLLVWIDPGDGGQPPLEWRAVFNAKRLIVVASTKSGNDRFVWYRMGLALDAVHNLTKTRKIDPDRIYVAGFSGGGRVACRLGLHYADVFRGGIYICGAGFYRNVPVAGQRGRSWPARMPRPAGKRLTLTKRRTRHVLLTGVNDGNRDSTKARHAFGFKKEGFKYAHYLEIPGLGHSPPQRPGFEQALALLDAPLATDEDRARRFLAAAKEAMKKDFIAGVKALEAVAQDFPSTKAGKQAKADVAALDD